MRRQAFVGVAIYLAWVLLCYHLAKLVFPVLKTYDGLTTDDKTGHGTEDEVQCSNQEVGWVGDQLRPVN